MFSFDQNDSLLTNYILSTVIGNDRVSHLYHYFQAKGSTLWSSSRYRHLSAPQENSNLVKEDAAMKPLGPNINIEPEVFIKEITTEEASPVRLDKLSPILFDQPPITSENIEHLAAHCLSSGSCSDMLMCQPLRLLELKPMFEVSSGMFQSSVLESESDSFVYIFRFCLSINEVLLLKELAESVQDSVSVFAYDVALNELEAVDISATYGDKNGLIFLNGKTKPLVLDLRSSIAKIDSEDTRKLFVSSLKKAIANVVHKHEKTEEI